MDRANVFRFPLGEAVDAEPKPEWSVRWWPVSTDAWMSITFHSAETAARIAAEKLLEGARKVEIERI